MNKEQYSFYLQSDHWEKVKKAMYSMKTRCHICFICEDNLNIHHITYKNIGHENYFDLVVLCKDCHKKLHEEKTKITNIYKDEKSERIRELTFFFMVYRDYDFTTAMREAKKQVYEKYGKQEIVSAKEIIPGLLKKIIENQYNGGGCRNGKA